MKAATYVIGAFFLDLAIGDPRWMPHPVTVIGGAITGMESLLRRFFSRSGERLAGVILTASIVLAVGTLVYIVETLLLSVSHGIFMVAVAFALVYLASTTLALRGLVTSARAVVNALAHGDIDASRNRLAMIVGRDTATLGGEGILRALVETVAENLSDGFVAPLFYLSVGGLPLAMAYKAINTLDSMVGYKNDRYLRLGWASARLDDVANYIPARITGFAIVVAAFLCFLPGGIPRGLRAAANSFRIMWRDGRNHTSPNSGVSEAAMAGALAIRLGGPSTYCGVTVDKPYIGDTSNTDYLSAAHRCMTIAVVAACLAVALALAVLLVMGATL